MERYGGMGRAKPAPYPQFHPCSGDSQRTHRRCSRNYRNLWKKNEVGLLYPPTDTRLRAPGFRSDFRWLPGLSIDPCRIRELPPTAQLSSSKSRPQTEPPSGYPSVDGNLPGRSPPSAWISFISSRFYSSDTCGSAVPLIVNRVQFTCSRHLVNSGTQNRGLASSGNLESGCVIFYTILENVGFKNGQTVGRHRQLHGICCAGLISPGLMYINRPDSLFDCPLGCLVDGL